MTLNQKDAEDIEKLERIKWLIQTMSPEFRDTVIKELAKDNVGGETKVQVTSNEDCVRVDFEKPLAWFALPKIQALQLGITLMRHAGAVVQQVEQKKDA